MINIKQYINESLTDKTIKDLKVVYNVQPEVIVFQIPESYSESDIQIYIGDKFLTSLPSDEKYGKKMFGKNFANINDAYFEYDKFEFDDKADVNIEWDAKYDSSLKEPKLHNCKITNLQYIILFDEFNYKSCGDNDREIIDEIFKAAEYNDANQYPLEIIYDADKTEYTE